LLHEENQIIFSSVFALAFFFVFLFKNKHRREKYGGSFPPWNFFRPSWHLDLMTNSSAGTILGQGRQDRERQCREREMKCFAGIGAFLVFCPEKKRSPKKKKKRVFAGLKNKKKGLRRIRSVFCPKNCSGYKSQWGQNSPRGETKISPWGQLPPYFPRL